MVEEKIIYYSNLKVILKSCNITQDALRKELNLTTHFTSNLANGKLERLEMDKIIRICHRLNCDFGDLLSIYPFKPVIKERVAI